MKNVLITCMFAVLITTCYGQVIVGTPAPNNIWKQLPQFVVPEQTHTHHWYAIENRNNPDYWENVNTGRLIICLKKGSTPDAIMGTIDKYGLQQTGKSLYPDVLNFYSYELVDSGKGKVLQIIYELKNSYNNIEYAEPEAIIKSERCFSNDPYNYPNSSWRQWSIYTTMIDSAWCTAISGGWGQWIGVIDNACDAHPDMGIFYGYDFADGNASVLPDGTGRQTHGTHVAGIAGAKINNSLGVAGVSNDTVYFAKVVKNGDTLFDNTAIVNAINDMAIRPKVRVINMSFGGTAINATIEAACNYAWSNNKLLIAASGNNAANLTLYPANYPAVIAVGSVGVVAGAVTFSSGFSNYGIKQEITAPGGNADGGAYDIFGLLPVANGSYGYKAGTSMAAPMVAGLAALMFDVRPSLTNTQARWVLQHSVFDYGASGWDMYYGYGMICGWCAVYNAIHYTSAVLETNSLSDRSTQSIYPNPNDGKFIVKIDSDVERDTQIAIYNTVGKIVWNMATPVGENSITVDLSSQPAGMYYAKIKNGIKEEVKMISVVK